MQPKSGRKKIERTVFTEYYLSVELEEKHPLTVGWEGHHQLEGIQTMCQPRAELRPSKLSN